MTLLRETGSRIGRPNSMEFFKFAVDAQVVRDLFGKIDSRVKNDGVARNA